MNATDASSQPADIAMREMSESMIPTMSIAVQKANIADEKPMKTF
jgi:hypothetical protein